ncbi:uncharacterized protein [Battus philenor]|uniref:uncharacterized protein n=1 Tax=Battus philenor TaxID=42288 RepID=UPI0035D09AA7
MWYQIILGIVAALSITAIKVPVEKEGENSANVILVTNDSPHDPSYFLQDDKTYLIPHEPERDAEVILEVIPKPATYLLPPLGEKQSDYQYEGTGTGPQSDWYPIAHMAQNSQGVVPIILPEMNETEALSIFKNNRNEKALQYSQPTVPTPSSKLEPPALNAPNDYQLVIKPSDEQEVLKTPAFENSDQQLPIFYSDHSRFMPHLQRFHKQKLIPAPQILPYKPILSKFKTPTKFYPKKYTDGFKPIPIPISQFADDSSDVVPKARPLQPFHPILRVTEEYQKPSDEKIIYLLEEDEKKRKIKEENILQNNYSVSNNSNDDLNPQTSEQQASESHFRYPERSVISEPSRPDSPRTSELKEHAPPPAGERTEFRMHGMKGPHSYQFGYDTGKGKNRQFRYEERDNDGHVRGHYGYMDRNGKLRVVNYDADPEHGFRAEVPVEKDQ